MKLNYIINLIIFKIFIILRIIVKIIINNILLIIYKNILLMKIIYINQYISLI